MMLYLFEVQRELHGYALSAVVTEETKEKAIKLLGWEIDEATSQIAALQIGVSSYGKPTVHAEESL